MDKFYDIDRMVPAMAYVPWQRWGDLFSLEEGFCKGTIFRVLYKPFLGGCRS